MRLTGARLFPLALMLLLALTTFWLERAVRDEARHPSLERPDPDYFVDNFRVTAFGAGGAVESVLQAKRMLHYPHDDSTELLAPRLVRTRPGEPPLTISAERGAMSADGDEVFLYDNVVLLREASRERPRSRIETSFLHLVRDRSLIRTDREIRVVEESRTLSGRGMEYHNDTGQLYIRENARGRFEPRPRRP